MWTYGGLSEWLLSSPATHATLFEDKVFGHLDWERHRSAVWRHRIEPTVFLRVAAGFAWQLALVVAVAVAVGLVHTLLPDHDEFLSGTRLTLPYTMMTFALSLLLVFKTNSSYSRWWEGRIIWGQVVNFGRNYSRQVLLWFPPERPLLRAAAIRWAAAAPRVLAAHVRKGGEPAREAAAALTAAEVEWLRGWSNAPLGVGTAMGQLVAAAGLPHQLQAELQRQVELYTNMAGGCERIFKTPIPPAYARHTSRFLMLYLVVSPVLLWPATGWLTPAAAAVIAFLLLGVENIGVQLEEPFRVLPLHDICRALEANILEMERRMAPPPPPPPQQQHLAPEGPTNGATAPAALQAPGPAPRTAVLVPRPLGAVELAEQHVAAAPSGEGGGLEGRGSGSRTRPATVMLYVGGNGASR